MGKSIAHIAWSDEAPMTICGMEGGEHLEHGILLPDFTTCACGAPVCETCINKIKKMKNVVAKKLVVTELPPPVVEVFKLTYHFREKEEDKS